MLEHFKDVHKIQEVLEEAQTGLWAIELDEGAHPACTRTAPCWDFSDLHLSLRRRYVISTGMSALRRAIIPLSRLLWSGLYRMTARRWSTPWEHPKWGKIYVRCGGVRDWSYQNGICLRGYHQNITNTVMLKQDYNSVIQSLSASYRSIFLCNLSDKSYKIVKIMDEFLPLTKANGDCEELLSRYGTGRLHPNTSPW